MTTLYLVRHGETDWNHERRVQGHRDPPLNHAGREQARTLAAQLAGVSFDAAYASDLRRAWQTAEILLEGRGVVVTRRPRLRERYLGRWEGRVFDEIPALDPDAWRDWLTRPRDRAPHGGETEAGLEHRALAELTGIVADHPTGTVLVVSHGGTIHAILRGWLGLERNITTANCGGFVIEVEENKKEIVSHIGNELTS
ncbi:MAG TPA: histidine phosphatase family protein [Chloroflexota bacterium]|nr:histidine phosphatase family protein [Chloroflexota bacterium]